MSLWIKCDICGEYGMHPSMDKIQDKKYNFTDWLMMDNVDLCRNCAKKIPWIKEINNRLVWEDNYNEEDVIKYIRENL